MKTLKQLLIENGFIPFQDNIRTEITTVFKEWLTQKRQEVENSVHFPSELKIIDELLEELE